MKRKAFTVAEVLVTLGIIGLVSAMTMPTLIQKKKKKVLINQLKVANSILSNVALAASEKYGPMDMWVNDYSQGTVYMSYNKANFEKYFIPYLKVQKYCKTAKGCFSDEVVFSGSSSVNSNANYTKALLNNGMSIAVASLSFGKSRGGSILVDVNGFKKPNQWGKDLFYFAIPSDGSGIYPSFSSAFKEGNNSQGYYSISKQYSGCYKSIGSTYMPYRAYCTGWALRQENMDYLKCTSASSCEER